MELTRLTRFSKRCVMGIGLFLLMCFTFLGNHAYANANRIYIECPCTFESTDDGRIAVTLGLRSFRERDTQYLRMDFFFKHGENDLGAYYAGSIYLDTLVPANGELESTTFYGDFSSYVETSPSFDREGYLLFALYRNWDRSGGYQDQVIADGRAHLREEFKLNEVDYLTDTDGDGVSDKTENTEGTDPMDPDSFPEPAVIDVLAFFSEGFAEFNDGDPYTRIRHIMTVTNSIMENSEVSARVRLVGVQPVEISDYQNFDSIDIYEHKTEGDRHGADMAVVFKGAADAVYYYCGYTYITGYGLKGAMPLQTDRLYTAYVVRGCGNYVTAHELGHILGLGHSEWQNNVGTWRWSRGHAVANSFHTVMSYSGQGGLKSYVFSNPDVDDCVGNDCGVDIEDEFAAHAALTINAVQWQFEDIREAFEDSDDDGFVDPVDAVPDDPNDWIDTDGDGIGNNSDNDDDGDGVVDAFDSFPLDEDEFLDSDLDGVGNNGDAFPFDPNEWADSDGDGVGDNADVFPNDPNEVADGDGDGVGDNSDAFPEDPDEYWDTDGDGVGDNADSDDDNDGYADTEDAYPRDASKYNLASYQIEGEVRHDRFAHSIIALGDINNDGFNDFAVGAPHYDNGDQKDTGAVYILTSKDFNALDVADGTEDEFIHVENWTTSDFAWKIVGINAKAELGWTLKTADVDGDGVRELVIGAPGELNEAQVKTGAVYLLDLGDLSDLDTADTTTDRVINIGNYTTSSTSKRLTNDNENSRFGISISNSDVDGNGKDDLLIGADQFNDMAGATYLVLDSALATQDVTSSEPLQQVNVDQALSAANLWRFTGKDKDQFGSSLSLEGDFDGDGVAELTIGSKTFGTGDFGAVFIVPFSTMNEIDVIDGEEDGSLDPLNIDLIVGTYVIESESSVNGIDVNANGDIDGDGLSELIIDTIEDEDLYLIAGGDLFRADLEDSLEDGRILLGNTRLQINSYLILGGNDSNECCINFTADIDADGDGLNELLLGYDYYGDFGGAIHASFDQIVESSVLDGWTPRQGYVRIWLSRLHVTVTKIIGYEALNGTGQSVANIGDLNQDDLVDIAIGAPAIGHDGQNPGLLNVVLSVESDRLDDIDGTDDRIARLNNLAGDTDSDGIKDTFDTDDDNDGYDDLDDEFPRLASEWRDRDNDFYGDNLDVFPDNSSEWFDTDFDGTGDNSDTDADGDGIPNADDEFPLDTDNDGIDNRFDDDDDNDGVNDDEDEAPLDPDES